MSARPLDLQHELRVPFRRDERARRNFTSALRAYVLDDMARGLRQVHAARHARARSITEVHARLRREPYFRFYSALRVTSQDMVYQTVRTGIDRGRSELHAKAEALARERPYGSLRLDPALPIPRSVTALDIHLMPGGYHTEHEPEDLTAGAIYDNRLAVSAFGLMGRNLDDIGQSMSRYIRERFPDFAPLRILDLGCTIGHNSGAWKDNFPGAEVHGIDVAPPVLRYALARARAQGRALHLHQMNAESLSFSDASFDLVFSSMFLHEVPRAGIARVFAEAHRVLRPGGLMLHMELPPNRALAPYDAFYLDWDGWYNNEPYYRPYRALDPRALCARAGFDATTYFEVAVPSWEAAGQDEAAWTAALARGTAVDSTRTGRLSSGVNWYLFGVQR